jgi:actin-related protein
MEEMASWQTPLIFDNGSHSSRLGFAGDTVPREILPTIVGYPEYNAQPLGTDRGRYVIGQDAMNCRKRVYPVERGVVADFTAMEHFWDHSFYKIL